MPVPSRQERVRKLRPPPPQGTEQVDQGPTVTKKAREGPDAVATEISALAPLASCARIANASGVAILSTGGVSVMVHCVAGASKPSIPSSIPSSDPRESGMQESDAQVGGTPPPPTPHHQ